LRCGQGRGRRRNWCDSHLNDPCWPNRLSNIDADGLRVRIKAIIKVCPRECNCQIKFWKSVECAELRQMKPARDFGRGPAWRTRRAFLSGAARDSGCL
jgi:hypothetical protein